MDETCGMTDDVERCRLSVNVRILLLHLLSLIFPSLCPLCPLWLNIRRIHGSSSDSEELFRCFAHVHRVRHDACPGSQRERRLRDVQ